MTSPPNTSQEGVVSVDAPPEPNRGREEGWAQGKSRGKSKAPSIDALEPCMATLETAMFVAQDTLDGLEESVDGLEGGYIDFTVATKVLIQDQVNTLQGEFWAFHEELLKLYNFI